MLARRDAVWMASSFSHARMRFRVLPDWLPTNRIDIANGKGGNSAILDVRYVLQGGAGGIQAMLTAV
jgi:hypothetical protein